MSADMKQINITPVMPAFGLCWELIVEPGTRGAFVGPGCPIIAWKIITPSLAQDPTGCQSVVLPVPICGNVSQHCVGYMVESEVFVSNGKYYPDIDEYRDAINRMYKKGGVDEIMDYLESVRFHRVESERRS